MVTWSDLAGETIASLVNPPKGGIGTVRAIVIEAREAVSLARSTTDDGVDAATAIRRLLDRLTDYDYTVLSTRGWALHPQTIPVTASQLGVAPVNVRRNQPRAYRRFRELLADPTHGAVVEYAEELRRRLGPLTRTHIAERALKDLGLDLASISSLRVPANTLGAQIDDTIVLAFNVRDNTVDMTRIPAEVDARRRLQGLLGKSVRKPAAALARALRCRPEDVAALLRRRGDKELLSLVTESAP